MSDWDEEIEAEAAGIQLERKKIPVDSRNYLPSTTLQSLQNGFEGGGLSGANYRRDRGRGTARGRARDKIDKESNWRETYDANYDGRPTSSTDGVRQSSNRRGFGYSNSENNGSDNSSSENLYSKYGRGSPRKTMEFLVFNDKVGKVIGKGGQTIRELQSKSGASLRILKEKATFRGTPVEISGSDCAVEAAIKLVEEINTPSVLYDQKPEPVPEYESRPKINWSMIRNQSNTYLEKKWLGARPISKVFYEEKEHVKRMGALDVARIRKNKNNITVQDMAEGDGDRDVPNPVLTFEDAFHNYPGIMETIDDAGFVEPTPIQIQSWPVLLSGMDMIGIAQTGTGKTLAFLLPAFIHIDGQGLSRHERKGPSCLVLSPTRELAQQIEQEVRKFNYKGIKSLCIYGGGDRRQQIQQVQKGVEIVIGTPGRLNDLLMNEILNVSDVTYLVLDEADRMLDMGFEPEIKKIILDIRPDRQTVMTSATWPPEVQRLADQYLKDPIKVNVGSLDLQACHSVTQLVEICELADKKDMLIDFIGSMGPTDKILIFVGRKVHVDDMASDFALRGVGSDVGIQTIHGNRCQDDREQALEDFRTGSARVLIATDVASRGLDIKDVTHVINYDFPKHMEEYVHRIGRTGRAGRSGMALSFITREDWSHAQKLIDILTEAGQEVPRELIEMAERYKANRERNTALRQEMKSGGGRGSGCFKCGGSNHWARDCPSSGGAGQTGQGYRTDGYQGRGRGRSRGRPWSTPRDEFW